MPDVLPEPTPETQPYWDACAERRLVHHRCDACGSASQHPRAVCADCGGAALSWASCGGAATLHSFVIVERPEPDFAEDAPYVLAVVDVAEGFRMVSRVVGVEPVPDRLRLDMPLRLTWLRRSAVELPVFAPEAL